MAGPAHGGQHSVRRVEGHGSLEDATQIRLDWKAVCFPDDAIHWELRWPLLELAKHTWVRGTFKVCEFMRKYRDQHSAVFEVMGKRYADEVFPSRLSCRSAGVEHAEAKSEYSATTFGLLCILGHKFISRQRKKFTEVFGALLRAFFERVLPNDGLSAELRLAAENLKAGDRGVIGFVAGPRSGETRCAPQFMATLLLGRICHCAWHAWAKGACWPLCGLVFPREGQSFHMPLSSLFLGPTLLCILRPPPLARLVAPSIRSATGGVATWPPSSRRSRLCLKAGWTLPSASCASRSGRSWVKRRSVALLAYGAGAC